MQKGLGTSRLEDSYRKAFTTRIIVTKNKEILVSARFKRPQGMPKKKKKEGWKEKRRRATLKREKALKAERVRIEREIKKRHKGWSHRKVFVVLCFVALLLISYGVWQSMQYPATSFNQNSLPSNENKAPSFTLTDIDGDPFSLADFKGKVVVLDLFRSQGCPACDAEIPELAKIHEKYSSEDVVILSISVSPYDTVELLQQFKSEKHINWTIAKDTDDVLHKYNVEGVPTLVIIDQEGIIYYRNAGWTSASTLSNKIDALLES